MRVSTQAIVLNSVKYGEADMIVSCFTQTAGLKSYMLRGIFKSRKGKFRPAMFQPLTQLSVEAIHKDKGTLERLVDAKVTANYSSLHSDLAKSSQVMFLSEILKMSIQEHESNSQLFSFLSSALVGLDQAKKTTNHHLKILLDLTRYLGFYPDFNQSDGPLFNAVDGVFQRTHQDLDLSGLSVSQDLTQLHVTSFESCGQLELNRTSRSALLALLLEYYQYHVQGFRKPKSLEVFDQIFH